MKIIIAGDYYPIRRAGEHMRNDNFEYLLGEVKSYVLNADYSIVNYESSFYGDGEPIVKSGPNMFTDEKSVELVEWCGFNAVTLANNHIHDYGDRGTKDLLDCLKSKGIDYMGAGMNLNEARKTFYKEICGYIIAFINCSEHEFNVADDIHAGANPLDVIKQYYAIAEAKKKADYVIVIVHGGSINCQLPSPRMKECYRFFIDCGADAVVNHHQHCFSGYEYYKKAPIVYGLGNFLFDKPWLKNTIWVDGYMLELSLGRPEGGVDISLIPYTQCADEPKISVLKDEEKERFFKKIEDLNCIIDNTTLLKSKYEEWCVSNEKLVSDGFKTIKNRCVRFLRHIIPGVTSESLYMLDLIYCESHLDRLLLYLKKKYNVQ